MNETEQGAVIDALRTQLAAVKRERDEARAQCHVARLALNRTASVLGIEATPYAEGSAEWANVSDLAERVDEVVRGLDEMRSVAASEPARIAEAEMARDVAWCEALRECGYPIARVAGIALGVDGVAAASVAEAATFGEDIAAAIRAAKP